MENDGLSSSVNPPMNSLSVNCMGNSMGNAMGSGMGNGMGSGMGNPMSNSMNKPMGTAMNTSMNKPMGTAMNTSMNKPMGTAMNTSMESTMGSGGNLFSLGGDSLHGMRGKELSPSFNGLLRSLGPSGGSFMLTPFTSDYAGPCVRSPLPSRLVGGASLATPAARTPGFAPMTPMNPLYLDNNSLMGDYPSDAGYSPLPASPYYNEDLSPRRLFPSPSSTNSRLLMTCSSARPLTRSTDAPPLQRSLSMTSNASLKPMTGSMAPSMTTPMTGSMAPSMTTPMTGSMTSSMTSSMTTPMEMGMAGSTIEYRGQTAFKSKERWERRGGVTRSSKGLAWQTGEVESFRGHIKDMSRDHNGCRTLQQCLDECPQKIVPMIYEEVGNELTELMMDSFGNYLFQKLLDVSSDDQRRDVVGERAALQRS